MKLILTHKRHLRRVADVRGFIRYVYGADSMRPILPVEGYMPGMPTGNPDTDTQSLLSLHHGGKAAMGRSIVLSSDYFPAQETATAHAPALAKAASAFRLSWAPSSSAISVVHLTKGKNQYAGNWRLDCHLILCNSDGYRGLQWSRAQCSLMQEMTWIPSTVRDQYKILPGKGTGTSRREKIPYPHAKNLFAYEIGSLSNQQIESHLACGVYGAARRSKDGRIVSVEAGGKRVNITRARQLVATRRGVTRDSGPLPDGRAAASFGGGRLVNSGISEGTTVPVHSRGFDNGLGHRSRGRRQPDSDAVLQRRGHRSDRATRAAKSEACYLHLGAKLRVRKAAPLARHRTPRAVLNLTSSVGRRLVKAIEAADSIEIITIGTT